jgi:hypothetical protein
VVAVVNLCGPMVTCLKTGKSAGSPSFEELPRTSHHRARCGPLYHRVLVFCNDSACFKTSNTYNNSFIRAMYVMYYASMLRCWQLVMILVKTDHPCLRVGRHSCYQSLTSIIHHLRPYFRKPMVRIRLDAHIRTIVVLTGGKLTWIYFLPLLYVIYFL